MRFLADAAGGPLANATTFAAAQGVATTLNVTDATNTIVNDNIVLFKISATEIQGRIDINGDGIFNDANNIALKIILDPNAANPVVTVEQIYAINHPDTADFDESLTLAIAGGVAGSGIPPI